MSFEDLKVAELREVAGYFGVDTDRDGKNLTKGELIAELSEEGVTYQRYEEYVAKKEAAEKALEEAGAGELEDEDKEVLANKRQVEEEPKATYLVRMTRGNRTYQTNGVTFTDVHPFALVTEEVADAIFAYEEGFRPATPQEAREYYS